MKSHTTILSIVFGFFVLNLILDSLIINYCLIGLMAVSLISETISNFIEKIWNGLAQLLSYIVPNLLLTLVFFLLLTPLALLAKLFNSESDYLIKNRKGSIFRDPQKSISKDSFEKAW
jgi:phage-related protein